MDIAKGGTTKTDNVCTANDERQRLAMDAAYHKSLQQRLVAGWLAIASDVYATAAIATRLLSFSA